VRIANGSNEKLTLGRLDVRRDWGWAPEYVEVMRRMWQQKKPDDYVVATEKEHSLQQFVAEAFRQLGLDWR
jgi:GDPmannose 4,6-dehydratase